MLQKNTTHLAGEFLVAGELSRRGYPVSITMGNAKSVDIYAEAMGNLAIPGRIAPPVDADRGVQVKEIDQTQSAFLAAYNKQLEFLKSAFGDLYQGDFSTVGIIFSDGVDVLHLDNLAMQLAMADLIDVSLGEVEQDPDKVSTLNRQYLRREVIIDVHDFLKSWCFLIYFIIRPGVPRRQSCTWMIPARCPGAR